MRRKTRRRKRRRRGGVLPTAADYAKIVANAQAGITPMPLPTYEAFKAEVRADKARERADKARKKFLKSGKKKPLPFGRNDDPEKMHGGRQYPKSRTHVYSRATPTHNIGRSSRSRRSKSRSKSRSRSRKKSRRSRRSRSRRRKRTS